MLIGECCACIFYRRLDHPNIVGYRGTKIMADQQVALAMEHCDTSLGNILEMRMDNDMGPLESNKILKVSVVWITFVLPRFMIWVFFFFCFLWQISLDVCKALDYLHTTAHILHGDLKSFNVLIKGEFDLCKLCDFGVSLPLNNKGYVDVKKKPDAEYTGEWSVHVKTIFFFSINMLKKWFPICNLLTILFNFQARIYGQHRRFSTVQHEKSARRLTFSALVSWSMNRLHCMRRTPII